MQGTGKYDVRRKKNQEEVDRGEGRKGKRKKRREQNQTGGRR